MVPNDQTEHVDLGKQNGGSSGLDRAVVAAATSVLKLGGKAAII